MKTKIEKLTIKLEMILRIFTILRQHRFVILAITYLNQIEETNKKAYQDLIFTKTFKLQTLDKKYIKTNT